MNDEPYEIALSLSTSHFKSLLGNVSRVTKIRAFWQANQFDSKAQALVYLLHGFYNMESSERRDQVFGLLGLLESVTEDDDRFSISADYSMSPAQVLSSVMAHLEVLYEEPPNEDSFRVIFKLRDILKVPDTDPAVELAVLLPQLRTSTNARLQAINDLTTLPNRSEVVRRLGRILGVPGNDLTAPATMSPTEMFLSINSRLQAAGDFSTSKDRLLATRTLCAICGLRAPDQPDRMMISPTQVFSRIHSQLQTSGNFTTQHDRLRMIRHLRISLGIAPSDPVIRSAIERVSAMHTTSLARQ